MLLNAPCVHIDESLAQHGEHILDDLRLRVVPMTSVTLLWHGPVETIVEVELAAPEIGMCEQKTMVEFSLPQLNH